MKKLSKTEKVEKVALARQLAETQAALSLAATTYNAALAAAWEVFAEALVAYNSAREDAAAFVGGVADRQEEYVDSKNDTWQGSSAAEFYQTWKDSWRAVEDALGDEVEVTEPEPVSEELDDHAGALEELLDAPETE